MRYIMLILLTCAALARADGTTTDIDLTPVKTFTMAIEQRHSLTGDRVTQTVDVSEGDSFRVVVTSNGIRWTTKGVVGKPKDNTISVQLTTEWYKNETSNERGTQSLDLKLSGENSPGAGAIHGVILTASIKKNELRYRDREAPRGAPLPHH